MKNKCVALPKPRAIAVNEILRSKTGGKHQNRQEVRSNRKSEAKREINASLKGSKWSPFLLPATVLQ
jgi:hypothetical protein